MQATNIKISPRVDAARAAYEAADAAFEREPQSEDLKRAAHLAAGDYAAELSAYVKGAQQ